MHRRGGGTRGGRHGRRESRAAEQGLRPHLPEHHRDEDDNDDEEGGKYDDESKNM